MTDVPAVSVTATVKWFDRKKGFGFATPEEGGEDIFVHQRNIVADGKSPVLDEGDTIYYELGEHNGRPTAINVRLPVGHQPAFEKRRRRGRNAKKEADKELEDAEKEGVEKATAKEAGTGEKAEAAEDKPAGGERPWKQDNRTRTRRNDKGAKPSGERTGSASSRRGDKKNETKQAARDSAGAAGGD